MLAIMESEIDFRHWFWHWNGIQSNLRVLFWDGGENAPSVDTCIQVHIWSFSPYRPMHNSIELVTAFHGHSNHIIMLSQNQQTSVNRCPRTRLIHCDWQWREWQHYFTYVHDTYDSTLHYGNLVLIILWGFLPIVIVCSRKLQPVAT